MTRPRALEARCRSSSRSMPAFPCRFPALRRAAAFDAGGAARLRPRAGNGRTQPGRDPFDERVGVPEDLRHDGERAQEPGAVAALPQPAIEEKDDAAVLPGADESPEALLEAQHRLGEHVVPERVVAPRAQALAARRHDRLLRYEERQ